NGRRGCPWGSDCEQGEQRGVEEGHRWFGGGRPAGPGDGLGEGGRVRDALRRAGASRADGDHPAGNAHIYQRYRPPAGCVRGLWAPPVGLGPTTARLTVGCSAIELRGNDLCNHTQNTADGKNLGGGEHHTATCALGFRRPPTIFAPAPRSDAPGQGWTGGRYRN